METVTVSRRLEATPARIRETIRADVPAFVRASGFDRVAVDGDQLTVARNIGLATFELTLEERDTPHVLALEQVDGIFDRMWTEYKVRPDGNGSRVSATTEFTLGSVLGPVLDGTMIRTRRTEEFEWQFDYLADQLQAAEV
jgi:hypothetical protein